MLSNFKQSLSINAVSTITTETGESKDISYMNASITNSRGLTVNNSIQNMEEYLKNENAVNNDFAEFQAKVLEFSKKYQETEV